MIYIHNVVSSSCHININAFLKKKVFYRQIVLYIYIVQFDLGQKKKANTSLSVTHRKNERYRNDTENL